MKNFIVLTGFRHGRMILLDSNLIICAEENPGGYTAIHYGGDRPTEILVRESIDSILLMICGMPA